MSKKVALFPGSFDPFTKGHEDIVHRALNLFDKIVICIGHNSEKKRYFDIDLMIGNINALFESSKDQIEVVTYDVLTAELAKDFDAKFLLRGLRNTTDFEYENSISQVNRHLNKNLETVFLITSPKFAFISSSIIREVHKYHGDVSKYVSYKI